MDLITTNRDIINNLTNEDLHTFITRSVHTLIKKYSKSGMGYKLGFLFWLNDEAKKEEWQEILGDDDISEYM
ncbi:MAG: hypothetical protein J6T10_32475 [Methanobrevibacter sp.]|nr:hypothetical protein [Methanobrevibacter sp.]